MQVAYFVMLSPTPMTNIDQQLLYENMATVNDWLASPVPTALAVQIIGGVLVSLIHFLFAISSVNTESRPNQLILWQRHWKMADSSMCQELC
jgi:hypothetical protein